MRATRPFVYKDGDEYVCEMQDVRTGRTWGIGRSSNREHAVTLARQNQPREAFIKRALGWIRRHPIRAGIAVGAYMFMRRPIKQIAYTACRFFGEIAHSLRFPEKIVNAIDNAYKVLP
jgi:hypothetical protein